MRLANSKAVQGLARTVVGAIVMIIDEWSQRSIILRLVELSMYFRVKYFRESEGLWVAKTFGGSNFAESGLAHKVGQKRNHMISQGGQ